MVEKILEGENIAVAVAEETNLLEMANMLGKRVVTDKIDFSFYFSFKVGVLDAIRVKIKWDRQRFIGKEDGYMELFGAYNYVHSADSFVKEKDIEKARQFFKKYKVLFAAVWELKLDPDSVQEYFRGGISFEELIREFVCAEDLEEANSLASLENIVRDKDLFGF